MANKSSSEDCVTADCLRKLALVGFCWVQIVWVTIDTCLANECLSIARTEQRKSRHMTMGFGWRFVVYNLGVKTWAIHSNLWYRTHLLEGKGWNLLEVTSEEFITLTQKKIIESCRTQIFWTTRIIQEENFSIFLIIKKIQSRAFPVFFRLLKKFPSRTNSKCWRCRFFRYTKKAESRKRFTYP